MHGLLVTALLTASSVASAETVWDGVAGTVRAGTTAPALETYDTPHNLSLFGPVRVGVGAERVPDDDGYTMAPRLGLIYKVDAKRALTLSVGYATINTQLIGHSDLEVVTASRDVRLNLGLTMKW
jgi:hypothetical protein